MVIKKGDNLLAKWDKEPQDHFKYNSR